MISLVSFVKRSLLLLLNLENFFIFILRLNESYKMNILADMDEFISNFILM